MVAYPFNVAQRLLNNVYLVELFFYSIVLYDIFIYICMLKMTANDKAVVQMVI